jgi:predicted HicB family RNase H-like nuclease
MKEKAPPTKPLRVSEKIHEMVKVAAAKLGMSMQELTEVAIARGLPRENPRQPAPSVWAK